MYPPVSGERVNLLDKGGFSLEQGVAVEGAENIGLTLSLAGMANRMLAFVLDSLITGLLSTALVIVFAFAALVIQNETATILIIAAAILLLFALRWGYFIIFELIWHGQTPGKKALRIKVVREDGRPVSFGVSFLRNIMRIVDALPGAYAVGLISIFVSEGEKRVGDIVAGTIVVREPRAAFPLPPAGAGPAPPYRSANQDLLGVSRRLSTAEMELLADYLERRHSLEQERRNHLGRRLAEKLARRLDVAEPADAEMFLEQLGSAAFPAAGRSAPRPR